VLGACCEGFLEPLSWEALDKGVTNKGTASGGGALHIFAKGSREKRICGGVQEAQKDLDDRDCHIRLKNLPIMRENDAKGW